MHALHQDPIKNTYIHRTTVSHSVMDAKGMTNHSALAQANWHYNGQQVNVVLMKESGQLRPTVELRLLRSQAP